ncbi:MAG: zinc ribbon domain-containing protein, partial [Clostridiales bacterium]|nr:zinc ribbon domain-containing protein [Clostridiales bacterium]
MILARHATFGERGSGNSPLPSHAFGISRHKEGSIEWRRPMDNICENCGQQLSEGAKFCRRCGAERRRAASPDFCTKCGRARPAGAAFCRHCGARANPTPRSAAAPIVRERRKPAPPCAGKAPGPRKVAAPRGGARRRRRGLVGAGIALLTVAIAVSAVCWFPRPERPLGAASPKIDRPYAATALSLSDVRITDADLNIPGASGTVAPDSPEVALSGATVSFGAYNLPDERVLTVKKLSAKTDAKNGYSIQPYDFTLEGMAEFHLPVEIEMAYEPVVEDDLAEANGVFVQHYDRGGGGWRLVPSWVNADRNTVTVLTNHFSTLAVFQDTEDKGAEGVVSLFRYQGRYRGPTTPVYTTGNAIDRNMAYVDESIFQRFIDTRTVPVRDAAAGMLDIMNQTTSGASYTFLATSQQAYDSMSPALGKAGMLFVFSKIARQWYNGVTAEEIILDNAFNLGEIALSATATAFAAPEITLIAAGVWVVGLGYEAGTAGYQYVKDSDSRYVAYRDFSEYGQVVFLPEEGVCIPAAERGNPAYARMRAIDLIGEYGWAEAFSSIEKKHKDDPRKITAALEALLESYLDAFWAADGNEILRYLRTRPAGLLGYGTMADGWVWPTESEIARYKAAYRERMKQFLAPVMKAMSQRALLELREQTYQAVLELWPLLNTEITFEILDEALPSNRFFPSSTLSQMHIALSPLSAAAIPAEWTCAERHDRSNAVFTCNLYAYIKAGCPNRLNFWNTQSDSRMMKPAITADFQIAIPTTVVPVSGEMEMSGIYAGTSRGRNMITGE